MTWNRRVISYRGSDLSIAGTMEISRGSTCADIFVECSSCKVSVSAAERLIRSWRFHSSLCLVWYFISFQTLALHDLARYLARGNRLLLPAEIPSREENVQEPRGTRPTSWINCRSVLLNPPLSLGSPRPPLRDTISVALGLPSRFAFDAAQARREPSNSTGYKLSI